MPTFNDLQTLAQHSGLPYVATLVFLFLSAYAGYVFLRRWKDSPIKSRLPETPLEQETADHAAYEKVLLDLTSHPFFSATRYAIKYRIPKLDISEPCRQLIFRDLLEIRFSVFLDYITTFLLTGSLNEIQADRFHESVLAAVSDSIVDSETKMKETGIPLIVITKFSSWQQSTNELIVELIDNTSSSRFYPDNNARMIAILDWLQASFQITLLDAEKTLGGLNGELDGTLYKGVRAHCKSKDKCQPCDLQSTP